jgi:hypothetical protein
MPTPVESPKISFEIEKEEFVRIARNASARDGVIVGGREMESKLVSDNLSSEK